MRNLIFQLRQTYRFTKELYEDFIEHKDTPRITFPPIPDEAFIASVYQTCGNNVLPIYLYQVYGIIYRADAELIVRAIPTAKLYAAIGNIPYTLLERKTCTEESIRELSNRIGALGSKKTVITVEL